MTRNTETATEQQRSPQMLIKATIVGASRSVNTTFAMPTARTVATTATEGTVTLKYTPRDTPGLSGKTSS